MSESIEYTVLKSKNLNMVHKLHNSYLKFDYCYEMKCGAIFHSYFSLRINSSNSNSKIQLFGQEFELDFIRDINEIDSNIKKCPYCFCNER